MDAPVATSPVGDLVRAALSSPWLSSLAVLNLLVLSAGIVALAMPDVLSPVDIWLTVLLIAYSAALWYRCATHPRDLVEMDTVFLVFFGMYVVLPVVAFFWLAVGEVPRFIGLVLHLESGIIGVALTALFAFLFGYSSPAGPALAGLMPRADGDWTRGEGLAISSGLLVLGTALVGTLVGTVGVETLVESAYARGYEAIAGLGVLASGVMLAQTGLVVLYLTPTERSRRAPILPWILFSVFALLMLRIGRRRVVLETILALLVAHHFSTRRIRLRTLVIGAALALPVFAAVGLARAYLAEGFGSILTRLVEQFGLDELVNLMAEPVTVLLALTETIYQVPAQEPFWLGRSFVDAFEILIPLPLHPERPIAPSQWFVNLIDPGIAAAGGGYSYALLAEGYLNFGILGVAAVAFVEGIVVRAAVTYRRLAPFSKSRILVYAVVVSLTIMMIRGDFASLLKAGIVGSLVPAVFVAAWLGRRRRLPSPTIESMTAGER
jgi:oligosaccharide repeat unit polymerase